MYETWIGIAFLMWLAGVIWFFISVNSQFERNLRKVGLRLSWLSLTPKEIDASAPEPGWLSKVVKFVGIYGTGLVAVVLGPIYVACVTGMFLYARWKDSGAPESVKEVRWKLRNMDMAAEEIQALMQGHIVAMRQPK